MTIEENALDIDVIGRMQEMCQKLNQAEIWNWNAIKCFTTTTTTTKYWSKQQLKKKIVWSFIPYLARVPS